MSPELTTRLRSMTKWLLLLGVVTFVVSWFILDSRISNESEITATEPEPRKPDEWLYVNGDNVLLWPVVKGECRIKYALMQVHRGTKVLVIARHERWVEIEQDDQTALHTHGCIHQKMLGKEHD